MISNLTFFMCLVHNHGKNSKATYSLISRYEIALIFIQLPQPKLDIGLFFDLAEFPCFYAGLA